MHTCARTHKTQTVTHKSASLRLCPWHIAGFPSVPISSILLSQSRAMRVFLLLLSWGEHFPTRVPSSVLRVKAMKGLVMVTSH